MLSNLFGSVNISSKLFTLKDNSIHKINQNEKNVEKISVKKIKENIVAKYGNDKNVRVIIKAFSLQPNLNGYEVIAKERKNDIKQGLIELKKIINVKEIKFVAGKNYKNINTELSSIAEVVKVTSITDLYNNKLIEKAFGAKIDEKEVLIIDLLDLVYLGQDVDKSEIIITVYGSAIEGGKVVSINEGTTYKELFTALNGKEEELKKVIAGGSLNGIPKYDLDKEIEKDIKGILFLSENDSKTEDVVSCIRCSKCLRVCPEGLNPIKLMELNRIKDTEGFIQFGGEKCIECGLCSFVCPSNIEVAQGIITAKNFIKK